MLATLLDTVYSKPNKHLSLLQKQVQMNYTSICIAAFELSLSKQNSHKQMAEYNDAEYFSKVTIAHHHWTVHMYTVLLDKNFFATIK